MLAGIGGTTVAEAKENLTADEFWRWCEYRNKYGFLSVQHYLCSMLATTNYLIAQAAGMSKSDKSKFTPADFMPGVSSAPKDFADIDDFDELLRTMQ